MQVTEHSSGNATVCLFALLGCACSSEFAIQTLNTVHVALPPSSAHKVVRVRFQSIITDSCLLIRNHFNPLWIYYGHIVNIVGVGLHLLLCKDAEACVLKKILARNSGGLLNKFP